MTRTAIPAPIPALAPVDKPELDSSFDGLAVLEARAPEDVADAIISEEDGIVFVSVGELVTEVLVELVKELVEADLDEVLEEEREEVLETGAGCC